MAAICSEKTSVISSTDTVPSGLRNSPVGPTEPATITSGAAIRLLRAPASFNSTTRSP